MKRFLRIEHEFSYQKLKLQAKIILESEDTNENLEIS